MDTYYSKNKEKIKAAVSARSQIIRFGGNREVAIKRDGEKCVDCSLTRVEHLKKYGVDITVDHIDGRGRGSDNPNNSLDNLQTLCLACHGSKDGRRGDRVSHTLDENWRKGVSKTWFKKGRAVPAEVVEANRKRMIENNPFKGKKHSEETRRIMSQKAKARWESKKRAL